MRKPLTRSCGICGRKPGEHDPAYVGPAVSVRVFQVKNVGRRGNQHAVPRQRMTPLGKLSWSAKTVLFS